MVGNIMPNNSAKPRANNNNSNAEAYLKTKVLTANPVELRMMLFDGAIRFAEQAKAALEKKDYEGTYNGATRCQAILLELLNSLKPEHDETLCKQLSGLYTYMYTTMIKGTSERNPALIAEVIKLLSYERQTWKMLIDQLSAENRAAGTIDATPDARPTSGGGGGGTPNADGLVGASVSVRG